jgi:hypothetical protein
MTTKTTPSEHRVLTREDLQQLLRTEGPAVSIYLPTHRRGPEAANNQRVLRGLLRLASERLQTLSGRQSEAQRLLADANELCAAPDFWWGCLDGMALFAWEGETRAYCVPFALPERVVLGPSVHATPLLPLLEPGGQFFVLALSRVGARLFRGDPWILTELDLPGAQDLEEFAQNTGRERQLQSHTGARSGQGNRSTPAFHGHAGLGASDVEVRDQRTCRRVAAAVREALGDDARPLVLAGMAPLLATYRAVSGASHLATGELHGNPDVLDPAELHARALATAGPFRPERAPAAERYRQAAGGPLATDDPQRAVELAREGRVELLFVALDAVAWKTLAPDGSTHMCSEWEPGAIDLVDLAAAETHRHGGAVFAVPKEEMPSPQQDQRVAAVLRF